MTRGRRWQRMADGRRTDAPHLQRLPSQQRRFPGKRASATPSSCHLPIPQRTTSFPLPQALVYATKLLHIYCRAAYPPYRPAIFTVRADIALVIMVS